MDQDDVFHLIKTKKRIGDLARTTRQRIHCPFCHSDGLDMQIYHDQNRFKCWRAECGRHGSPIDWVMFETGCDVGEAVRVLAAELGIEVVNKDMRAPVLQKASRTFVKALSHNQEVVDYWASRGIKHNTLYQHHVGYCSEETLRDIIRAENPDDRIDTQTLEDTALLIHGRAAFWNHTVFPYRHWRTRDIVQMQGRLVGEANDGEPRWKGLNTRSKLGSRSVNMMLWGEEALLDYYKRPGPDRQTYAYLLEGIPDALTLRQQGLHALSVVGNQNLRVHTNRLKNLDSVYLVMDNDKSSQDNLPGELYDMLLEMPKTRLVIVTLPNLPGLDERGNPKKQDVNEFFVHGSELGDFMDLTQKSPDAAEYLIDAWGHNETRYEPLLTMVCERPQDERPRLLQRLESKGLFTLDQLSAFARMMRLDETMVKSRYRRSKRPQ